MSIGHNKKTAEQSVEKFKQVTKQVYVGRNGKLNKVSIGLSVGILALMGALVFVGVQRLSPTAIQTDVVNGISSEEGRKVVQQAFLDSINAYMNGDITEEEMWEAISNLIADYLNSSSAFTDEQKLELNQIIQDYLNSLSIEDLLADNQKSIDHVQSILEKYMNQNAATLEALKNSLQTEINNNLVYTNEQLANLQDLYDKLAKLEVDNFQKAQDYINETYNQFKHYNNETNQNMYGGLGVWEANKEYAINTFVIYKIADDYAPEERTNYNDGDIRIYQNVTGNNTSTSPNYDKTNWKEQSLATAIQQIYNVTVSNTTGGIDEWSADKQYGIDEVTVYRDKLYINITGTSNATSPDNDTTNWKQLSQAEYTQQVFQTFIEKLYNGIPEWSADSSYTPNSYVMYHNKLYRNITGANSDITPDLDTTNWAESSIMTVINNTYNTFKTVTGAKDYDPSNPGQYVAGDYVIYNNTIYKNVSDNPSTSDGSQLPNSDSAWKAVTITEMIDQNYQTFINAIGAEDYNPEHSYQVGDYAIKDGQLQRYGENGWETVSVTSSLETLTKEIEKLQLETSTNLEDLNKNLIDLINENASLSDEQRAAMLEIINNNSDSSAASLETLKNELLSEINSESSENEKERQKLIDQLEALASNTSSYMYDYEQRIQHLEDITSDNTKEFEFGYNTSTGTYGYYVNGVFKPW